MRDTTSWLRAVAVATCGLLASEAGGFVPLLKPDGSTLSSTIGGTLVPTHSFGLEILAARAEGPTPIVQRTRGRLYLPKGAQEVTRDASAMKWLTPDPIGERGGANLTAFCSGDPINQVDPDGRNPVLILAGLLWLALDRIAWAPEPDISPAYIEAVEREHQLRQVRTVSMLVTAPVGAGAGMAMRAGLSRAAGGALTHSAVGRTTIWLGQTAAEGGLTVGLSELLVQSVDERPGVDVGEVLQTSALGAAGWVAIKGTTRAIGVLRHASAASADDVARGHAKSELKVKYIGKMDDLRDIPRSQTLLDDLPNLGSAKANYYQNSSVLRKALRDGFEIRDASAHRPNWSLDPTLLRPDRTVGQSFLGAERLILDNKGFILDPSGAYMPR